VSNTSLPSLYPEFHYHDATAGIAFLERVFGFGPSAVHTDPDGRVVFHADIRVGRGYVMTATLAGDAYAYAVPRDIGNASTGSTYVGMPDVESVYARVRAAGVEIVRDMQQTDYGSRDFSVRDGEGVLWHFGTYRPTVGGADPYASPGIEVYCGHRYEDARAAIAWLVKAFGFAEHEVHAGEGDQIAHAQLSFGNDIFMTGSARDDIFAFRTPAQLGGRYTHAICGYADDPDGHCARARAAGAEIMQEPADQPYGARVYVARDPEGFVWCFGTYRPSVQAPAVDVVGGVAEGAVSAG